VADHRRHHAHADDEGDVHSPRQGYGPSGGLGLLLVVLLVLVLMGYVPRGF
jgi:hypothetical protein